MDDMRRKLLTGAIAGGAAFSLAASLATGARAQNAGQNNAESEKVQSQLQDFNGPELNVTPVGEDWAQLHRYHDANTGVAALPQDKRRVVMMGDSITDNWAKPDFSGTFYADNGLIGRGISGQVSAQMLVRFMPDVVALRPQVVHIMAGTNDVAENKDPYDPVATTNNLQAMISLGRLFGMKVLLASVPPALSFSWRPGIVNPHEKIVGINTWLKSVAAAQGCTYVDYWPVLATPDGGLKPELGINGNTVHPNVQGYALMQPILLAAVNSALAAG
ncbi:GDSL-type esterase/lipase family protein [Asticcacaulis sp. EMRT-3]|uniref:GDSL-type esterase/lipase family protein n=1 Tax=Asticcacaulis sp. EMRT-3 TaxID=3040349 RepID=UPI0024AFD38E|nr:GDSL-type esterase/lipase family protein [Asticcacaulis sp. EMRT-3]MDI7774172.1 GDSL-type esterase/lipase family protein [Asticcacaulis sp. EMRT-3]